MEKKVNQHRQRDEERLEGKRKAFLFLGGNLALDLVNTEIMVRGKRVDLLRTPQDAVRWWEMARQTHPQDRRDQQERIWDERQLADLRALRQTLRNLFEALTTQGRVQERDIRALNVVLQEGYYALALTPEGKALAVYQAREGQEGAIELSIAFAALSLLKTQDLSRLHACQNERCMLLFYDTTRSATRHWCRVACTNRARSRQNYRRAKEAPPS